MHVNIRHYPLNFIFMRSGCAFPLLPLSMAHCVVISQVLVKSMSSVYIVLVV